MKLLEAANAYSPIVSTTMGAEGIPFESFDGNNNNTASCIIANTSEDFINGIILLQNNDLIHSLSSNAFSIINNNYSFDKLKNNRLPLYQ